MATKSPSAEHNDQYDYILGWIRESQESRRAQNAFVERAIKAYHGHPSRNRYSRTIDNYAQAVYKTDPVRAKKIKETFNDIPEKKNMTVQNAVETLVSMTQGGVGQYEFGPYDPDMRKDKRIIDRLSSAAKHFHIREKVDSLLPQLVRMSVLTGGGAMHLKPKEGRTKITLLSTNELWTDPKRSKTNAERFIGHEQRASFKEVWDRVQKDKDSGAYQLETLNEAKVYIDQIVGELNDVRQTDATRTYLHDELREDIDLFYKPLITQIKERKEKDKEYQYNGDEIAISYIYDLQSDMYFEVINRRYVITAKKNDLSTNIEYSYTNKDGETKTKKKECRLDHPYVELPYRKDFWNSYAATPLFDVLDDFDDLCAMESVLYHNLSIMAPLTFIGQSTDAEIMARTASVSGEVAEGLPQTFGVLDKTHNLEPIIAAIQRNEDKIKRVLKAIDPFEMQGMLGDRATAKEVVSASGQVSQGINPFIANVETAMATLGDKFIKMQIIFGEDTYSFTHNGEYAELAAEDIAGDWEINAKLVSSIKLEQEVNARKAIELVNGLGTNEAINKRQFFGTLIPIAMQGIVNRQQAEAMVKDDYQPMPEEVIARIKKQAEEEAKKHPIDKLDLSDMTEDEFIATEQMLAGGGGMGPEGIPPEGMPMQPGMEPPMDGVQLADPNQLPPEDPSISAIPPADPEVAGELANDPQGAGFAF